MGARTRLALAAAAITLVGAPTARAQPVRGVLHQRLVALLNPMGMEHTLRAGLRAPLGDPAELLFTGAHVEAGGVGYVSPIYAIHGGYLEVTPLAFLSLRAEVTGTAQWPLGMDGAGYYAVDGYDADVNAQSLPGDEGGSATGWTVTLSGTLQGMVPLGSVSLILADRTQAAHASVGDAPFRYAPKYDLVVARQDWVVTNDALVLLDVPLDARWTLRAGAYDDLRWVPASGYVGNQVGPIAVLSVREPADAVRGIDLYVRGGWYTHHGPRQDELTVLGGVSVSYDLGRVR